MTIAVLPGDVVSCNDCDYQQIGPGLAWHGTSSPLTLVASKCGLSGSEIKESAKSGGRTAQRWIESYGKRYIPSLGEPVVGVIVARHADGYRVDIGSHHMATLDALAFEGATKRSKPNLRVGAIVYARVALAQPFAEPELECIDAVTRRAQGYGELTEGMLVRGLMLQRCRTLLQTSDPLLPSFGARFPFECAIGVNGRIWIKTTDSERTTELIAALRGDSDDGT